MVASAASVAASRLPQRRSGAEQRGSARGRGRGAGDEAAGRGGGGAERRRRAASEEAIVGVQRSGEVRVRLTCSKKWRGGGEGGGRGVRSEED